MPAPTKRHSKFSPPDSERGGKLRIGDDWNAITIIALSQSNPLKAVAEFVENSIDAHARQITITRGKERGEAYLRIEDDGDGIALDEEGNPNFRFVATHICDSLKRRMKTQGATGIQGEFGIGLLSFWTVGAALSLVSAGKEGRAFEMRMAKGDPTYSVQPWRRIFPHTGTRLTIRPLLAGIRHFSGEKLQWYLASELRDRIKSSGVRIRIVDRQARFDAWVEPRAFEGSHLTNLPEVNTPFGDAFVELYLCEPTEGRGVNLTRGGTRVLERISDLEDFNRPPWNSGHLQGILDAPFLQLTPGTRLGVIHDERFEALHAALAPLEERLCEIVKEQQQTAEDKSNRDTLKSIQRAFREAISVLPEEEYDWFELYGIESQRPKRPAGTALRGVESGLPLEERYGEAEAVPIENESDTGGPKALHEHPGPMHTVRILPRICVVPVGQSRVFRGQPRDRKGLALELQAETSAEVATATQIQLRWEIIEGGATLDSAVGERVTLRAPEEPQLVRLRLTASQGEIETSAEALVTITDSLLPERPSTEQRQGLPDYTFQKAPGELWRSRYEAAQNLVIVNSGHRDFVYVARQKSLKLRYLCRLFAKELVLQNFPGGRGDELLERMIELSIYTEEKLR